MAAPGDLLDGRYRLGPILGRGGMADVYRAHDEARHEDVAVKLLRTAEPTTARWLDREQAALGRLDHPALVRMRATGTVDGQPYLVLDLIDGRPLSDILRNGPLSVGRSAELGAYLADGLAHAHAAGVTHRDVKPANILVDAAGRPHLADFGIARLTEVNTATAAGVVLGTAAYLAPEQVRAEPVGPPADVYALGVVLIECITGERCYPGPFAEAAMAHLARPPVVPATLPADLRATLVDATAMDPNRRPSAAVLARSLASGPDPAPTLAVPGPVAVTEIRTPTQVMAAAPYVVPARRKRRGTVVAAAVGGLAGLTIAIVAVRANDGSPPADPPPSTAPAAVPLSATVPTTTTVAPTTTAAVVTTTVAPPPADLGKDKKKPKK